MGRVGEVDHPHLADRRQDEGAARPRSPRSAATTTTSASAATSRSTRSTRRSRTASPHEIGSVEVGKLADLVLWRPAFFGVKPELVIKGGFIAWAQMGDAERVDPDAAAGVHAADVRRARRRGRRRPRIAFVSQRALAEGARRARSGSRKRLDAVRGCRGIGKRDMKLNDALPRDRGRPRDVRGARRRRAAPCEPAPRAAARAALLPVLMR